MLKTTSYLARSGSSRHNLLLVERSLIGKLLRKLGDLGAFAEVLMQIEDHVVVILRMDKVDEREVYI